MIRDGCLRHRNDWRVGGGPQRCHFATSRTEPQTPRQTSLEPISVFGLKGVERSLSRTAISRQGVGPSALTSTGNLALREASWIYAWSSWGSVV